MKEKLRILIISHYFPPANGIASLRPYSWAKYWSRMGYSVTVLTTKKERKKNDLTLDCSSFEIIEVENRIRDKMKKAANYQDTGGKITEQSLKVKLLQNLKEFFNSRGIVSWDARMPNLIDFWISSAYQKVNDKNWDLVVSTFAPYACHLIARKLKLRNQNTFWIADYRDLWTESHMFRGLFPFTIIEEYLERKINTTADLITTVSYPLAEKVKSKYKIDNVEVVENGFDPEDLATIPSEPYWNDGKVRLVYTGSIYKGQRDPSPLFEAIKNIAQCEKSQLLDNLEVLFVGEKGNLDELLEKYKVEKWVKYIPRLPREEALRMQRDAHALIFLESESPEIRGILTGKLFEYLYSGTQILSVGLDDDSSAGELISQSGHGINFGRDSHKLQLYLEELLETGSKPVVIRNTQFLEKYSRKALAEKMINLFQDYSQRMMDNY